MLSRMRQINKVKRSAAEGGKGTNGRVDGYRAQQGRVGRRRPTEDFVRNSCPICRVGQGTGHPRSGSVSAGPPTRVFGGLALVDPEKPGPRSLVPPTYCFRKTPLPVVKTRIHAKHPILRIAAADCFRFSLCVDLHEFAG